MSLHLATLTEFAPIRTGLAVKRFDLNRLSGKVKARRYAAIPNGTSINPVKEAMEEQKSLVCHWVRGLTGPIDPASASATQCPE